MSDTACGFVALIGAPNAGKSTLINALVGSKVSVVSRKAQTTRTTVRGIVIDADSRVRLVIEERLADNALGVRSGPYSGALLTSFLESLQTELRRRSRFNRAVDL